MHPYLVSRRRLLVMASRTYREADDAWRAGLRQAAQFVPEAAERPHHTIGNPGSRIRRLYEDRERALDRLANARQKMAVARRRLEMLERGETQAVPILEITFTHH